MALMHLYTIMYLGYKKNDDLETYLLIYVSLF